MWRRLTQACLVWISLCGLIPAALACAQTMVDRDCCPPGQQMPCEQAPGQSSVEAAACCATANLAPAAVAAANEHAHFDTVLTPTGHAPWTTLHSFEIVADRVHRHSRRGPPDVARDLSLTYLQTGRLRL